MCGPNGFTQEMALFNKEGRLNAIALKIKSRTALSLSSVMVMEGIHDATRVKKRGYTPTTSMGRFTRELYAIVKFSNILVQKERRVLNLEDVPKIIRTKLYSSLK